MRTPTRPQSADCGNTAAPQAQITHVIGKHGAPPQPSERAETLTDTFKGVAQASSELLGGETLENDDSRNAIRR